MRVADHPTSTEPRPLPPRGRFLSLGTPMTIPDASPIRLYDTTLRDGTQREGLSLSVEDKVKIARALDGLGVHYIEGGWPGSNPKDAEFFRRMQRGASLGRARWPPSAAPDGRAHAARTTPTSARWWTPGRRSSRWSARPRPST